MAGRKRAGRKPHVSEADREIADFLKRLLLIRAKRDAEEKMLDRWVLYRIILNEKTGSLQFTYDMDVDGDVLLALRGMLENE